MCYLSIINLTFRDPYTGETANNRLARLLGCPPRKFAGGGVGIYYKGVSCSQDGNLGATSFSNPEGICVTSKTLRNIPERGEGPPFALRP